MQKEKLVIFTLSRQQKITPNCKWGGGLWAGKGGQLLGAWGGLLPGRFFFFSLHMCVCEDHQELPTPGRVGSGENVVVVVDI